MTTKLSSILGCLFIIVLYFIYWPTGVDAISWEAPQGPGYTGEFSANTHLQAVELLAKGVGVGGEDVAVDGTGRIYTGYKDGRIMRFSRDGTAAVELINTGGRPLGLDFDATGHLIVADADLGLLRISPEGDVETLSTGTAEHRLKFTDDVAVAPDGRIYFSDASSKYDRESLAKETLEHRANGLLLRYDPASKSTEILLGDLYFANGVAVSPDNTFVLVAETTAYRIRKLWLAGEKAGTSEVILDNLPGLPDGISRGSNGRYWVPLVMPRSAILDGLAGFPNLRQFPLRLPKFMAPKIKKYGFVLGIQKDGSILHNLQDGTDGCFAPVTSVEENAGYLYLGSLEADSLARLPVPN